MQHAIPVERTAYGYEQRTRFRNADLYHEEVQEIDSVWMQKYATGTQVLTFLLLGDQNAGKSTFIHSFTYEKDANFRRLFSILPLLTSSFINSRFLASDSSVNLMDQAPFLDTDVASGTMLVSLENFLFFLDEYDVDNSIFLKRFPSDTRHVCIQLIEVGGDHLDRLIIDNKSMKTENKTSLDDDDVTSVMFRSRRLISTSLKSIYFVNCQTIFLLKTTTNNDNNSNEGEVHVNIIIDEFNKLISRLDFLSCRFKDKQSAQELLLYASRSPIQEDMTVIVDNLKEISNIIQFNNNKFTCITNMILSILCIYQESRSWNLEFPDCHIINHIDKNKILQPTAICTTLSRLLKNNMMHSMQKPLAMTAKYIFQCWQCTELRINDDENIFSLFINQSCFQSYLEELEFIEVPDYCLVREYNNVVNSLTASFLCLRNYHSNRIYSILFINHVMKNGDINKYISNNEQKDILPHDQVAEIRFPYFHPLFLWLQKNMEQGMFAWSGREMESLADLYNIADDFEVDDDNNNNENMDMPEQTKYELKPIIKELENLVTKRYNDMKQDNNDNNNLLYRWIWALEEWALGKYLYISLFEDNNNISSSSSLPILTFPVIFQTKEMWMFLKEKLNIEIDNNGNDDTAFSFATKHNIDRPYLIKLSFE